MLRVLSLLVMALLVWPPQLASARFAQADLAMIDQFVTNSWHQTSSPGLAYAIVRDGKIIHARGLGRAAGDTAVTPATAFGIGSMTKSFTALAIMQLVDSGQVALDAPVQRYLPWFTVNDAAAAAQITVRQLLNQTSGLPMYAGFWRPAANTSGDVLEQRVRALADVDVHAAPGTRYAYSNANFDVAGLIIQTVSGQSYAEYIATAILAPLGMTNSYFPNRVPQQAERAAGHHDWIGLAVPATATITEAMWPGGGLYSSAEDLARYLAAQLDGGRGPDALLTPESFATLHQASGIGGSDYALGWDTARIAGVPVIEHGGASPAFHSSMLFAPQHNIGVVVLSNIAAAPLFGPLATEQIANGIFALLVGQTPNVVGFAGLYTTLVAKFGLLALTLWGVISMPFEIRRLQRRINGQAAFNRLVLGPLTSFAVGLALLFGLPRWVGTPLWAMWEFSPDVALLLGIGITSAFVSAAIQTAILMTTVRQRKSAQNINAATPTPAR